LIQATKGSRNEIRNRRLLLQPVADVVTESQSLVSQYLSATRELLNETARSFTAYAVAAGEQ
jgi:hypothetical protein